MAHLGWKPIWNISETIEKTASLYWIITLTRAMYVSAVSEIYGLYTGDEISICSLKKLY